MPVGSVSEIDLLILRLLRLLTTTTTISYPLPETTGIPSQPLSTKLLHYWSHTNRPTLLISQFQANLHQLHSNKTSYLSNFPLSPILVPLPPPLPATALSRLLCHASTMLCQLYLVYSAMPLLCPARPSYHQPGQATRPQQSTRVRAFQSTSVRVFQSTSIRTTAEYQRSSVPMFQCSGHSRVPEFQCSHKRRREQETVIINHQA